TISSDVDWLFLNPPYSRGNIYKFMTRSLQIANKLDKKLVSLIKVGTSTKYWGIFYDYRHQAYEDQFYVRFFPKRIKFIHPTLGVESKSPNIEVCLVVFDPDLFDNLTHHSTPSFK